jgi:hypothetical protein
MSIVPVLPVQLSHVCIVVKIVALGKLKNKNSNASHGAMRLPHKDAKARKGSQRFAKEIKAWRMPLRPLRLSFFRL